MPWAASEAYSSGTFQEAWRTSSTSGSPRSAPVTARSHSRPASFRLNDQGNWSSAAPSLPAPARMSSPSRAARTSAAVKVERSWVKRRHTLAVKRKSGRPSTRDIQDRTALAEAGR